MSTPARGRCVMVKTSVFQTEDEGSIPSARSILPLQNE